MTTDLILAPDPSLLSRQGIFPGLTSARPKHWLWLYASIVVPESHMCLAFLSYWQKKPVLPNLVLYGKISTLLNFFSFVPSINKYELRASLEADTDSRSDECSSEYNRQTVCPWEWERVRGRSKADCHGNTCLVQVRAEGQRDIQDTILQTVWSEVTEKVHCDL